MEDFFPIMLNYQRRFIFFQRVFVHRQIQDAAFLDQNSLKHGSFFFQTFIPSLRLFL